MVTKDRSYQTHDLRRLNIRYGASWWERAQTHARRWRCRYPTTAALLRSFLPRWDGRL